MIQAIKAEHPQGRPKNKAGKFPALDNRDRVADVLEQQGTRTDLGKQHSGNFPQGSKSRDLIAQYVGVSGKTLEKDLELLTDSVKAVELMTDRLRL